jgi:hypothetical protein
MGGAVTIFTCFVNKQKGKIYNDGAHQNVQRGKPSYSCKRYKAQLPFFDPKVILATCLAATKFNHLAKC